MRSQAVYDTFGWAARVKFEKLIGKNKTVVMAETDFLDQMDGVFIDECTLPAGKWKAAFQRYDLDLPGENIDELQVLMPMHDLKAGIAGIAGFVYDIENKVRKRGILIEIYGIQIALPFHDD